MLFLAALVVVYRRPDQLQCCQSGRVVPERAYADSCILGPSGAGNHRAFTHSRVSVASRVACERPIAERIVERPGRIAKKGLNAKRIIIVAGCVGMERLGTGGRVLSAA